MKTAEEIILNLAKERTKNGDEWLRKLPDLKSFMIEAVQQGQINAYNEALDWAAANARTKQDENCWYCDLIDKDSILNGKKESIFTLKK